MSYGMTIYVSADDIASAADGDGELLADVLNAVTEHASKRWVEDVVAALSADGRALLSALARAALEEDR